jgi:RNA polymerase sigma factor (sigma-70 family)
MRCDDTAIGGPGGQFPSTQFSLLDAAAEGLESEALDRVIGLYWKPVYRFVRVKFGKDNEDAKDLTQSFFATALQRDFFARFDPAKASFRTYLRMAVEHFAANQHAAEHAQKRGGEVRFLPVEEHDVPGESAEDAFEREWRRQLFSLALEDLRALATREDKPVQFAVFEAYDLAAGERPTYAELAARFGIAATSITNYLVWARRSLRSLVTERLRGVTGGERELREEMRRLWN